MATCKFWFVRLRMKFVVQHICIHVSIIFSAANNLTMDASVLLKVGGLEHPVEDGSTWLHRAWPFSHNSQHFWCKPMKGTTRWFVRHNSIASFVYTRATNNTYKLVYHKFASPTNCQHFCETQSLWVQSFRDTNLGWWATRLEWICCSQVQSEKARP